jgi:hypothetical protein
MIIDYNTYNKIKCIQINLQRSKSSTSNLVKLIEQFKIDLALVQEPYVIQKKVCGIPLSFRTIFCDSGDKPKAAIIIANKYLQIVNISTFTCDFSTFIKIELQNYELLCVSVYCSPTGNIESELDYIRDAINRINHKKLIISIDSNAHSTNWFNEYEDERGRILNDFIAQNNLIIMNENETIATYHTVRNQRIYESSIDITLANLNATPIIKNWQILLSEESLSDHRFIYFEMLGCAQVVRYKSTIKFNTKRADWGLFEDLVQQKREQLLSKINSVSDGDSLDLFINYLNEELNNICMQSMPLQNNLINIRANKWWCDELTSLRSRVNNLRRKYQRCQTIRRFILQEQYQCLRNAYKNRIIELKRKCWELFIEESTRDNPWGIVYKISKDKLNIEKINELVQSDGSLITDNESIAKTLLDKLFPEDDSNNDSEIQKHIRSKANEVYSNPVSDPLFEYCELEHVVKHQNPKKAPGEDGFTAEIVKNLYNAAPQLLLNIYNKCLELFYFPNQWKSSVIKVIKKAGKDDYRLPNSYRPISLLSIVY